MTTEIEKSYDKLFSVTSLEEAYWQEKLKP